MATRRTKQKAPTVMGEPGARLRTSKDDLPSTPIPGKRSGRKRGPDPAPIDQEGLTRERRESVDRADSQRRAARNFKAR